MDWEAHAIGRLADAVRELGLGQSEAHPLDTERFKAKLADLKELVDDYLGCR